ncbi:hypothetical protein [uncultured Gammaproteobacteria bacterium]|nr:hypothetical protein [uncultured Gammaproteobacteria bacterium]
MRVSLFQNITPESDDALSDQLDFFLSSIRHYYPDTLY